MSSIFLEEAIVGIHDPYPYKFKFKTGDKVLVPINGEKSICEIVCQAMHLHKIRLPSGEVIVCGEDIMTFYKHTEVTWDE